MTTRRMSTSRPAGSPLGRWAPSWIRLPQRRRWAWWAPWARLAAPGGVLAVAAAGVTYVALVDPNQTGNYPTCPFLAVTGQYCPGCGTLRTVHALAHGDVAQAVSLNLLTVAVLPLLGFFWLRWARARFADRPVRVKVADPRLIWALLGVVLAFWLLRNLPFGAFLAP